MDHDVLVTGGFLPSHFCFVFVDWAFFRFCSKWPNAVAYDLGRCFLIFFSVIITHVSKLPLLMALMRFEDVGLNIALCRNVTTSSVIPSGAITFTVLWVPSYLIMLIIVWSYVYYRGVCHNPVCFS